MALLMAKSVIKKWLDSRAQRMLVAANRSSSMDLFFIKTKKISAIIPNSSDAAPVAMGRYCLTIILPKYFLQAAFSLSTSGRPFSLGVSFENI